MSPTSFLGSPPDLFDIRRQTPERPDDTNRLVPGDIVQSWDPWFVWDDQCENYETRKEWRAIGDPLCDAALNELLGSSSTCIHGLDLLEELNKHIQGEKSSEAIQEFMESISVSPPDGIRATPEEIQHAQSFFAAHSMPISMSLLYFSLAGGFASPRISRVLRSTSYLTPSHGACDFGNQTGKERAATRLFETLQFVIDIMGGSLPPSNSSPVQTHWTGERALHPGTGEGWKSCIRVRLLHAVARSRVLEKLHRGGAPRFYEDGVPINQEDMAHTLSAFSFAPLHCLRKFGYSYSRKDADATIAFWRHVGFYLGVKQDILRKHFANWDRAGIFGATCGQILVLELIEAKEAASQMGEELPEPPTKAILAAFDQTLTLETRLSICRYLLGPKFSSLLNLPKIPRLTMVQIRFSFLLTALPSYFGNAYPLKRWEEQRRRLMIEGVARVTRFRLGMRRTAFRPRTPDGELKLKHEGVESVEKDPVGLQRFQGEWRLLVIEMFLVSGLACVLIAWIIWQIYCYFY